ARRRADQPGPAADSVDGVALRTGYPRWIVAAATQRFGATGVAELRAGNDPAGLTVRGDDVAALRAALEAAGVTVTPGALDPAALHLDGMAPGDVLDRFPQAVIQDEASMVVARVAAAAAPPDGPVLDVCAAPGGKATHLAILGRSVVAADRSATRMEMVADLASRVGVAIDRVVADGARHPWPRDAFAGALVDAPCSGLGVVRRRPELRWRRDAADIPALAALQGALLDATASVVRRGGALVYSVCTWTTEETAAVVEAFLARRRDFAVDPDPLAPRSATAGPGLQLNSALHGCDGMYVVVLRRGG
ncbi:MAG: 16S rRNA (cytosine(967)-C(5))-methyltransferase RsmB, partial [Actinobacteria bacterium]|nr:16S rRNA (cytosine(967)-C(5))-methyltransferase RsmB [Actinomycetota bacterium]